MKKVLLAGLAIGVIVGMSGAASAASFSYSGPAANNVDTASVTTVNFNIADTSIITDLNVYINVLGFYGTDGFPGNNNIWLEHGGVSVALFSSTGIFGEAAGGIMDISFDDEAVLSTPHTPPFTGLVKPIASLSAFDGLNLSGTWTLNFQDPTVFPGEGDSLIAWSLYGEATSSTPVPEPATMLLFGAGIAGLAAVGRRKRS